MKCKKQPEKHGFECARHTKARLSMSTCLGDSSDPETDSNRTQRWGSVTAALQGATKASSQGLIPHQAPL